MLGRDGYIFVNGASDAGVNGLFEGQCQASQSEATYQALLQSLPKLKETSQNLGVTVHAIAVPMTATLYADHLPRSVSPQLRSACLEVLTGETRLSKLDLRTDLSFIYPFTEMKALRDTEGFFPKANYHPMGMSLKVIRDVYLKRAGIDAKIDETLVLKRVPSEILNTYGVTVTYPEYEIRNDRITEDAAAATRVGATLADLFLRPPVTKVYANNGGASRTACC